MNRPDLADLDLTELLSALGLSSWISSSDQELTVAGVLCLGHRPVIEQRLPSNEIAFQCFEADGALTTNEFFRGPLLTVIEDLEVRFDARNKEVEADIGLVRVSIPDYPKLSFREGLLNALVHRDYSRLGSVYLQMHPDRLSITSPGGFPHGVSLANLLVHEPAPRNRRLADVFLRLGLVERSGRGIDRIFMNQLRFGRPAPDYSGSDQSAVRLVLPGGNPSLRFVQFVLEEERKGRPFTLGDLLVLNSLQQDRSINGQRTATLLQTGEAAARRVLEGLVERGLISRARRAGEFGLSPALYRSLGSASGFVRSHGFDPIQQRAMVGQYVEAHGRITRAQTADLCQVSSGEAKALLRRMRSEGLLALEGSRRTSSYVAGANFEVLVPNRRLGTDSKVIGQVPKVVQR